MATTYYFPDANGLAAVDPNGTGAGQNPFTGSLQGIGGYTKVVVNAPNNGVYTVTFNYDDPNNAPVTTTLYQTQYTSSDYNESTNADGSVDYLTSNNAVSKGVPYTIPGDGTQFTPNAQYLIDPEAPCFASGTQIRTLNGNLLVETLAIGDFAITASGACRLIRWLGHRTLDCRNHPRPQDVQPIRILAHAFGESQPARDLYLSPGHPVLVGADEDGSGGHLVPIMCLVNGTTIERVAVDEVTYWHVELDEHDILLAEGLRAESYIDLGSRPWFDGADGALYDPDMALPGMPGRCRPVAIDGSVVEAERARLDAVFAARLSSAAQWPVQGGASLTF